MNSFYACNWAGPLDGCLRIFCRPGDELQKLCQRTAEAKGATNTYAIVKHLDRVVEYLKKENLNIGSDFIAQHPMCCVLFEKLMEQALLKTVCRTERDQQTIANMASGMYGTFNIYLSPLTHAIGFTDADRQHWERLLAPVWQAGLERLEDFKPAD